MAAATLLQKQPISTKIQKEEDEEEEEEEDDEEVSNPKLMTACLLGQQNLRYCPAWGLMITPTPSV